MPVGFILFIVWMALEVVVVAASIAWGFENGQWKDIEEPNYRMLVDHELQGWPGRAARSSVAPSSAAPAAAAPSTTPQQSEEDAK